MAKFVHVFHCRRCGHKWKVIAKGMDIAEPPCPNLACGEVQTIRPFNPEGAPAIGGSTIVKAVDFTADLTMQQYGLTDLKDNVREGDTLVPTLPPTLQKQKDDFFNPKVTVGPKHMQASRLMSRAISGAYRGAAVNPKELLPDNRVALRPVRSEKASV